MDHAGIASNVKTWIRQAKSFGEVNVDADVALMLAEAPKLELEFGADIARAGFGGVISGTILGWVVFRHESPETRSSASLHRAFRMVENACKKGGWRGATFDNLRKNIWPIYSPVAHLWAALQILEDRGYSLEHLAAAHGMYELLIMSEWFRLKGEACIPLRANASILDPEETWKVRPEVSEEWPTLDIQCRDLDAWDLGVRIKKRPR